MIFGLMNDKNSQSESIWLLSARAYKVLDDKTIAQKLNCRCRQKPSRPRPLYMIWQIYNNDMIEKYALK